MEHCTYSEKVPYNIIIEKLSLLKSNDNFLFHLILLKVAYAENLTELKQCVRFWYPNMAIFTSFSLKVNNPRAVSPISGNKP